MKELVIISGKGGTGKTSIVAALATLFRNKILCDADVDAPDLHLLSNPNVLQREEFISGHHAVIRRDDCIECGLCKELCRWNAIGDDWKIDRIACEGCGVCVYFCPEKAIDFPESHCGEWYVSDSHLGPMVHARLFAAEENSGKLVSLVRNKAKEIAEQKQLDLILTDGPPGTGCPVIASIGGANLLLIVTEPTVSGKHDMERVVELARHFKIPAMICINKYDLNPEKTQEIEEFAKTAGLDMPERIPFDVNITKAMVQGKTVFEYAADSVSCAAITTLWESLAKRLK